MQLCEQYRPTSWQHVVGQDKAIATINRLRSRGLSGRAYWITGSSGTGKTTIARLLASEVADDWNVQELDAAGLTAGRIQEIERLCSMRGFGRGGHGIIVNEAHGLSAGAVRQLLTTLERIPAHVVWCFTTTTDGEQMMFDGIDDTHPLLSRCITLPLARRDLSRPFAERCKWIAMQSNLDGKPIEAYERLAKQNANNLRAMLMWVEAGKMLDTET